MLLSLYLNGIWVHKSNVSLSCHKKIQETLLLEKGTSISSEKWLHLAKVHLHLMTSGADRAEQGWSRADSVAWSRVQAHIPVYRSARNAHDEHCQSLFSSVRCISPFLGKSPRPSFSHGL